MRTLFVLLILITAPAARAEQALTAKVGEEVRVMAADASTISGELVRVEPEWVVLRSLEQSIVVAVDDVTRVEVNRIARSTRHPIATGFSYALLSATFGAAMKTQATPATRPKIGPAASVRIAPGRPNTVAVT